MMLGLRAVLGLPPLPNWMERALKAESVIRDQRDTIWILENTVKRRQREIETVRDEMRAMDRSWRAEDVAKLREIQRAHPDAAEALQQLIASVGGDQ